ncbi:MAG: arginine deiminase family protein [Thermoplasmata archaeon]|jgi:arginine deiminase
MEIGAWAEWHPLTDVMVHRPGIEMFFGLLEPYSFLYERTFSMDGAVYEHEALEHALVEEGVRVHRLKRTMVDRAREQPALVERARRSALRLLRYDGPGPLVRRARRALRANLARFDAESLFNILLLHPSVLLAEGGGTRNDHPRVALDLPLANLYFLRDQQALTHRGLIQARMSKPQRRAEPELTRSILELAGARFIGGIRPPGTFEGGDFLPAGRVALLGTGDRTNAAGIRQILGLGLEHEEIAVVHQPKHPLIPGPTPDPMVDMHLDTYLNLAGEHLAVGLIPLLQRARTEVYRRRSKGRFVRDSPATNLYDYLRAHGFEIVPLTTLEQLAYASNFLTLSDRRILAIEVERVIPRVLTTVAASARAQPGRYGDLYRQALKDSAELKSSDAFFPHKPELSRAGVEVHPVLLEEITGGYGGAHCMTAALHRRPEG